MNRKYDLTTFLNNLWLRENAKGLQAIEGEGGYRNGRYFPYETGNGNIDVGPGFDLSKQTKGFVNRAYSQGYTKEELDSMVMDRAYKEIPNLNKRITKEGRDTLTVPDNVYNGLLDMFWQVDNGLYGFNEFWKGVGNNDYQKMRDESATYYTPVNGIIPKNAITKNGKVLDKGRWEFRKNTYFQDPVVDDATKSKAKQVIDSAIKGASNIFKNSSNNSWLNKYTSFSEGGSKATPKLWNDLSMAERAEVMRLALQSNIYNLDDIRSTYNEFASGGSIHIDPSKKGTFTAAATKHGMGVQAFASKVLANKDNYSPAMVKKANFARNASKWHADGGNLFGGGSWITNARDAATAAYLASERNKPHNLRYNAEEDYYEGGTPFQVTVTGTNRYEPKYQWVSARTPQLTADDVSKAYTAATVSLLPNPIAAANNLSKGDWMQSLKDLWLYNDAGSDGNNNAVVGFGVPESSLFGSAKTAAKATPKQWTAAQDAAIARGDIAEAQRLRDLHFKVSAPNTEIVDVNGNPQLVLHKTPHNFTVFDNSKSEGNLNWFATPNAYGGENGVFATGAGKNPHDMHLYVNMKNGHKPTIEEGMSPGYINEGEDGILGIIDKNMTDFFKSSRDAGEGFMMSGGVDNPYALKSADAVTYNKNGVRIPLGSRDNFKLNDIRYNWLLPIIGLGGATLYGTNNGD